jgi:hypothetical protein
MSDDEHTGVYELMDAIEAVIKAADKNTRDALADTMDAYCESFPDEFFWATGVQSPMLLYNLMACIDASCRSEGVKPKSRAHLRLVDRKPDGGA